MEKNRTFGILLILFGTTGFFVEFFSFIFIHSGCFGGTKSKFLIYCIYILLLIIGIKMIKKPAGNNM